MTLPPALKKSMPTLGKFGIWLGVSALTNHLTNSPELAEALTTAGVGVSNLDAACEVVKGIASGKLSDYYKEFRSNQNFGANDNLQLALREGIANALSDLEITFSAEKKLSQDEKQQIGFFFRSLAHHLSKEINADSQVTDYVLDRTGFFRELLKKVHALPTDEQETNATDTGVLTPELSDETTERLIVFLVDHIEPVAQRFINEEFKTNDEAKTAYFIHLLEYSARLNKANNELLIQVSQSLDDIGRKQQEHTDLLRQIAQAQQRIYDFLRTLNLDFKAFMSDFDQLKDRINTRLEPSLRIPNNYKHPKKSHEYKYELRYTSFISRDAEINQLWDFLNGQLDRRMLWWLVTGPGGMGKNRLALEFCLEARHVNRYVGFLESHHIAGFDWSQWRPSYPTLLVIDHVAAHAKSMVDMIGQISRSAQDGLLTQPVRVLLLERETRDEWWESFSEDLDVIESSYVSGKPDEVLALPAFSDADRWQIITEIHHKEGKPLPADQHQTIQNLIGIDPEGRPLFAFLAGMALAKGEDIRRWDVDYLLDSHLRREEREIWAKHSSWPDIRCREGHKNLLVLTTLTRGLTVSQLKALLSKSLPWLPDCRINVSLYERLSEIRERQLPDGTTEKSFEGLQPDLVGEYYVLKRIEELLTDDFTGEETVQALLQSAWDTTPEETWWSIYRALSDFGYLPTSKVRQYVEESRPRSNASETAWGYWSYLQFNLTTNYGRAQQWSDAESCYKDLRILAQTYPANQAIVLSQAKGALNLMNAYGRSLRWDRVIGLYEDLKILAESNRTNQEIMIEKARAAMNLTTNYGKAQQWDKAELYYEDLKMLARTHPDNQDILLKHARGAGAQLYFATEVVKINRKPYFLGLLQVLEGLLSEYAQAESWQKSLPLLLSTRDDNQWLKA